MAKETTYNCDTLLLQVSGNFQHPLARRFLDPDFPSGFHDLVQYIAAGRSGELPTLVTEEQLHSYKLWLAGLASLKTCEQTIEGVFTGGFRQYGLMVAERTPNIMDVC